MFEWKKETDPTKRFVLAEREKLANLMQNDELTDADKLEALDHQINYILKSVEFRKLQK